MNNTAAIETDILCDRFEAYRTNSNVHIPINAVPFMAWPLGKPKPDSAIKRWLSGLGMAKPYFNRTFSSADVASVIDTGTPYFRLDLGIAARRSADGAYTNHSLIYVTVFRINVSDGVSIP